MGANTNPLSAPEPSTLNRIERRMAELLALCPAAKSDADDPFPSHEPLASPHLPATNAPAPQDPGWPTLAQPALYGLAGQVVRALEPHSEAEPHAILLQFLAAFGNALGPRPHAMVASTRHGLNLFVVLVGQSSKARKGTSWRQLTRLFAAVDEPWFTTRITNARLTADGLIRAVRDQQPPTDRRLLILSEEFSSILQPVSRPQGHLSPVLLSAWDHGDLRTLDRHHHSLQATGAHISLIGHVTRHALAPFLHGNIVHNGFANRCLWACVCRAGCLPDGGDLGATQLASLGAELRRVLASAAGAPYLFQRNQQAQQLWQDRYFDLSAGTFGAHGAATSRGEAQVLRLSAIYAALDGTAIVELPHLEAAYAVWDYCCAAAGRLFSITREDEVAATIRATLLESNEGLSRDQVRKLFSGHVDSPTIDAALAQLAEQGFIHHHTAPTAGRRRTVWQADPESQVRSIEEELLQN